MSLKKIFKKNDSIVVAEIGNNHEGDFNQALKLIDAASISGADAVKFQTYKLDLFYAKRYVDKKRLKRLKKFQLSFEQFYNLSKYSKKKKIAFFSTPLDLESALFLNKIQKIFKISSSDNNFLPLINLIKKFKKPLIISTGLLYYNEIKKLIRNIKNFNKKKLILLHCVSNYPASKKELNLNSIPFLKKKLPKFKIGYSDHSLGIDACKIALSMGSVIVEKHFTLDKNFSNFHDHKISANPKEMKDLCNFANSIQSMLGYFNKKPSYDEINNYENLRRSPYLKQNIITGEKITDDKIEWLRPGIGIKYKEKKLLKNKISKKNIEKGTLLNKKILKDFK
tara:strand:- start:625 stop:1638 length:1014 start_codon:yes stop_codon:yes gene_type:complete